MTSTLLQASATKITDAIITACDSISVTTILQSDVLNNPQDPESDEEEAFPDEISNDGSDDLVYIKPALAELTRVAAAIDQLGGSYNAEDAEDLLGDTNAYHLYEDYTESMNTLYDRYRTALHGFAEEIHNDINNNNISNSSNNNSNNNSNIDDGQEPPDMAMCQRGMQALAKVLKDSCDPLPYRLRKIHTALVGSGGGVGSKKGSIIGEDANVLLRVANDRCIEEADDFLAYYITVRRLFLHLVAGEVKALMIMAVALRHAGVPHYIQPSDLPIARALLAEQDAFIDRVIPTQIARLAERVLSATEDGSIPRIVCVKIRAHGTGRGVSLLSEGSDVVCHDSGEEQKEEDHIVWGLECAQPLPKDATANSRYTFRLRSGVMVGGRWESKPKTYLGCDKEGSVKLGGAVGAWRIVPVPEVDVQQHSGGGVHEAATLTVAFRLQYQSTDAAGRSNRKWLALPSALDPQQSPAGGDRVVVRELEDDSPDFLFGISVVEG